MPSFPTPENVTDVISLFGYSNTLTSNVFSGIMLFVVWLVIFISLKQWQSESALTASTFITFILSVFMLAGGLVGDWVVIMTLIAMLASAFLSFFRRESGG